MIRKIISFFDKLEDRVRGRLSHYPIVYAFIGGAGVVMFWRGVWHTTDYIMETISIRRMQDSTITLASGLWWDGPLSIVTGSVILLLTGVFVSNFIGNEMIITGLRGDKKLTEKTEKEVRTEAGAIGQIKSQVQAVSRRLEALEQAAGATKGSNERKTTRIRPVRQSKKVLK